jgi:membrane protein implicated in regulation of membrane protease activity
VGPAGWWLIAALALGIAELAIPGVFLVFLAIAAGITGLALFALPDLPLAGQIVFFGAWSVATVLIGRRWYVDYPVTSDTRLNDRVSRMIGEIVEVDTALVGGRGRVRVGDGTWPATGDDLASGARARIVAVEDGVVRVEAVGRAT